MEIERYKRPSADTFAAVGRKPDGRVEFPGIGLELGPLSSPSRCRTSKGRHHTRRIPAAMIFDINRI